MTQLSALIVVGGRNSIINWLGLHGRNPKIRCYDGSDLQLYVVRKKHRTAKNLTMLVFTGSKCQLQGFGDPDDLCKWDRKEPDWGFTPQELSGMLPGILYRV